MDFQFSADDIKLRQEAIDVRIVIHLEARDLLADDAHEQRRRRGVVFGFGAVVLFVGHDFTEG